MKTTIYHNAQCSKSCAALQILEEQGEELEVRNYLEDVPTEKELGELVKKLNIKPQDLVRKNEPVFLEKFDNRSFTDEEWLCILHENPVLIERPIVLKEGKAIIGRPPKLILDIL